MRKYSAAILMTMSTLGVLVGCYTVNLRVSGERSEVDRLRAQLAADSRAISDLKTEVGMRARVPEVQRWNDTRLLMSAPVAAQILRSPMELASYAKQPDAAPMLRYAVTAPVASGAAPIAADPAVRVAYAPRSAERAPQIVRAAYAPATIMPVEMTTPTDLLPAGQQ